MRKIIHADCDCFFAAVEMRDDPRLRGRPLAVGGDPAQRGVIATCNYEARRYGVHSAQASAHALRLCPQLIILPPDFARYKAASQAIRGIFHDYTAKVEPLSLDEAYLDVSGSPHGQGSATRIAEALRARVRAEVGVTISCGVAPNKFLAKVASDWRKPDGLFVIRPQQVADFVAALPVERIHGVGRATAARLHRLGLKTCGDIRRRSVFELTAAFGSLGPYLHRLAHGDDDRPVHSRDRRRSLSVEATWPQDLPDAQACRRELPGLQQRLHERLQRLPPHYRIARVFVKVKFSDFAQTTHEQAAAAPDPLLLEHLLAVAWQRRRRPVRLLGIGVGLADLRETAPAAQLDFFAGGEGQLQAG